MWEAGETIKGDGVWENTSDVVVMVNELASLLRKASVMNGQVVLSILQMSTLIDQVWGYGLSRPPPTPEGLSNSSSEGTRASTTVFDVAGELSTDFGHLWKPKKMNQFLFYLK